MVGLWKAEQSGSSSRGPRSDVPRRPLFSCRPPVVSESRFHRSLNTGQEMKMNALLSAHAASHTLKSSPTSDQSVVTH